MSKRIKDHLALEKYLTDNFIFRLNEVTGAIEFMDTAGNSWNELNEFNIYRQLKLGGFKTSLNELIFLLKSDFVKKYDPFQAYFKSLDAWSAGEKEHIQQLCNYVGVNNAARFERHFLKERQKNYLVRQVLLVPPI